MKKFLAALAFYLSAATAGNAGVSCALPFTLTNDTTADANQVMANYNAILTCLQNAAAAGANSDITSLLSLSTPIPPNEGGSSVFYGPASGSTGSANAQVVSSTTPTTFALTFGYRVIFYAGLTNTGATTFAINGTAATAVRIRTNAGLQPLQGGEIIAGTLVDSVFDGTFYEIMAPVNGFVPAGSVFDFAGTSAPQGYFLAAGQCVSRTTFANLFAAIGTTYGGACAGTDFALPDARGRLTAGVDNMGGTPANRITNAGSACVGTTLGNGCGGQSATLSVAQLPVHTPTGTIGGTSESYTPAGTVGITDPTHTHTVSSPGGTQTNMLGGGAISVSAPPAPVASNAASTGVTAGFTGTPATVPLGANATFTGAAIGSGTAHAILNPVLVLNKIIKY